MKYGKIVLYPLTFFIMNPSISLVNECERKNQHFAGQTLYKLLHPPTTVNVKADLTPQASH